jgi:hypothetical protein
MLPDVLRSFYNSIYWEGCFFFDKILGGVLVLWKVVKRIKQKKSFVKSPISPSINIYIYIYIFFFSILSYLSHAFILSSLFPYFFFPSHAFLSPSPPWQKLETSDQSKATMANLELSLAPLMGFEIL